MENSSEKKLKAGVLFVDNKSDLGYFFDSADEIYALRINLSNGKSENLTNLKLLDYISKNVDKFCANRLQNVELVVGYERLPKHIFEKLCEFDKNVAQKLDCKVCVNHGYKSERFDDKEEIKWSIGAIVKANAEIDRVCDFIKKSKFSQLETLAFVHSYVARIAKYNLSKKFKSDWCDKDQYFAGIFEKLPQVVCMGYSSFMKEIIDNLNMPGLECEIISVAMQNKLFGSEGGHARCFVKVKDDKYHINQTCFDDATWDEDYDDQTWQYSHFALSNHCHDDNMNGVYEYYIPYFERIDKKTGQRVLEDYNAYQSQYDKGQNKMSQKLIEEVFFSVMQKSYKSKSFDEIYLKLGECAELSYSNQVKRGYKGYLTERKLQLSPEEAKKIYENNLKSKKSIVDFEL